MDKPLWGLRVDGAAARGLWPPAGSELHPTGKTTHYILCVATLLQNVFAVHRFRSGGDSACGAEGGGLPFGQCL